MFFNNKVLWFVFGLLLILSTSRYKAKTDISTNKPTFLARVIFHTPGEADVEVSTEIAKTPQERAHGLMGRKYLPPHQGMLFIFPEEQQLTFWMKDTLIELDIIFIRTNFSVLGCIERAEPLSTVPLTVNGLAQYVLEVKGGFCSKHNISPKSTVEIFIKRKAS